MYTKFTTIVLFLIGSSILFNLAILDFGKNGVIDHPAQEGIAVVELFTSQGCSSCPSADRLLSRIIDEAENEDQAVYGLSFHVDYWNRLGWKDPYSQRAFTERQYAYARQMRQQGVYTPQMVVNGQAEFVGSNRGVATSEISKAQSKGIAKPIEVKQISARNGKLAFEYSSPFTEGASWLNIALVERGIATQVKHGENGGRLLKHDNVVRSFQQQDLKSGGEIEVDIPADLDLTKSSLILYTQKKSNWHIDGATRVSLAQMNAN